MKETEKQPDLSKKKRIYQVAKEFNISNEAVTEFLELHKFKVRNIMAPLTDEQVSLLTGHFQKEKEETETAKEPDFRKKIQDKKKRKKPGNRRSGRKSTKFSNIRRAIFRSSPNPRRSPPKPIGARLKQSFPPAGRQPLKRPLFSPPVRKRPLLPPRGFRCP